MQLAVDMALTQPAMVAGARSALLFMRAASLRHTEASAKLEAAQEGRHKEERSLRAAVQESGRQRLGKTLPGKGPKMRATVTQDFSQA